MGHSPSIQELRDKQQEVDKYLDSLKEKLSGQAKSATDALQQQIKTFYSQNNWANTIFVSATHYDFMQQKDWSLSNVKAIIDTISLAVFGDPNAPSGGKSSGGGTGSANGGSSSTLPSGQSTLKTGDNVNITDPVRLAMDAMGGLEVYIASKIFDIISGVIESFGTSTSVDFQNDTKSESLGNGFQLFITVAKEGYQSSEFFDNEFIQTYMYTYEVHYSHDQAVNEGDMTALPAEINLYVTSIQKLTAKLAAELDLLMNGNIDQQQYQSQTDLYNKMLVDNQTKLNALQSKKAAEFMAMRMTS